jgi:hypothetical protein
MDNNSSIHDVNDVVRFQIHSQLNFVGKMFLEMIEDLEAEGYKFGEEKRSIIRKRILDRTNDAKRTLENTINKFDIQFKKEQGK